MQRSKSVGSKVEGPNKEWSGNPKSKSSGKLRRIPTSLLILAVLFCGIGYYGYDEFMERLAFLHEEDARIQSNMVMVSSRVAGWATSVVVREGSLVKKGTVLASIDQRESRALIEELTAQLEAVAAEEVRLRAEQDLVRKQTESRLNSVRLALSAAQVTVSSLEPQLQ